MQLGKKENAAQGGAQAKPNSGPVAAEAGGRASQAAPQAIPLGRSRFVQLSVRQAEHVSALSDKHSTGRSGQLDRASESRGLAGAAGATVPTSRIYRVRRGLWYQVKLAWCELAEEFRSDKPYSPFLLLLGLEVLLVFCGAAFLYSNSNSYMLQRHAMWLTLGISISLLLYLLPIRSIVQGIPYLAVLALLLNALPQIPGLQLANAGSPRWIRIWGYSFQVSETLRLMLVLYFARRIDIDLSQFQRDLQKEGKWEKRRFVDYYPKVLWRPLIYLLAACLLVILQKDYSTTVLLIAIASAMSLLVGSWATLGIAALIFLGVTAVAMLFLGQTFRINRINDWIEGSGEQINWVFDALRQGGWFGIGLGQGSAKHLVPVEMTDFPLVAVGEEAGFLGIILIFLLFLIFAIVGFLLARQNCTPFVRYTTAGLSVLVFMQAFVNFAVSCGILPVTGQPLPFFSVGGSSTLTYLVILGLLNSLNRPCRNLRSEVDMPQNETHAGLGPHGIKQLQGAGRRNRGSWVVDNHKRTWRARFLRRDPYSGST